MLAVLLVVLLANNPVLVQVWAYLVLVVSVLVLVAKVDLDCGDPLCLALRNPLHR